MELITRIIIGLIFGAFAGLMHSAGNDVTALFTLVFGTAFATHNAFAPHATKDELGSIVHAELAQFFECAENDVTTDEVRIDADFIANPGKYLDSSFSMTDEDSPPPPPGIRRENEQEGQ